MLFTYIHGKLYIMIIYAVKREPQAQLLGTCCGHVELPGAGSVQVLLNSVAGIVKSPIFPLEVKASLKKCGRDASKAANEKFNAVPK